MKRIALIIIVIALVMMAIGSQAKPTPYWRHKRHSNGEVYTYSKPNWGASSSCAGMYPRNPIKDKNLKRYHFYRHPNGKRRNKANR